MTIFLKTSIYNVQIARGFVDQLIKRVHYAFEIATNSHAMWLFSAQMYTSLYTDYQCARLFGVFGQLFLMYIYNSNL